MVNEGMVTGRKWNVMKKESRSTLRKTFSIATLSTKIPHGLTWFITRASEVTGQR